MLRSGEIFEEGVDLWLGEMRRGRALRVNTGSLHCTGHKTKLKKAYYLPFTENCELIYATNIRHTNLPGKMSVNCPKGAQWAS